MKLNKWITVKYSPWNLIAVCRNVASVSSYRQTRKWSLIIRICSHACYHPCYAILLDSSHPSALMPVRPKPLSGWAGLVVDWGAGALRRTRPHTGVCAVQCWSGAKIRPENETSTSFTLQLSSRKGAVCGLHQHTYINSQYRNIASKYPLLLQECCLTCAAINWQKCCKFSVGRHTWY